LGLSVTHGTPPVSSTAGPLRRSASGRSSC
jgi:hypothetical protein